MSRNLGLKRKPRFNQSLLRIISVRLKKTLNFRVIDNVEGGRGKPAFRRWVKMMNNSPRRVGTTCLVFEIKI